VVRTKASSLQGTDYQTYKLTLLANEGHFECPQLTPKGELLTVPSIMGKPPTSRIRDEQRKTLINMSPFRGLHSKSPKVIQHCHNFKTIY